MFVFLVSNLEDERYVVQIQKKNALVVVVVVVAAAAAERKIWALMG
jgi:hypothetical protein